MPRSPARPHPAQSFAESAKIATAIRDHNAGRPMNRILLAQAMGRSPGSSDFRDKIMSAARYGLISGNFNAETVTLTPLGQQYTSSASPEERLAAERSAIRKVPIFNQILQHYNNNKLPGVDFLKTALEREPFSVAASWSREIAEMIQVDGKAAGLVRTVGDGLYVVLDAGPPTAEATQQTAEETIPLAPEGVAHAVDEEVPVSVRARAPLAEQEMITPPAQRQFFLAHGKNRKPLDQLKKMLGGLQIPYIVAEEEPNVGRPISQKVADLMKSCSAGIFIFTADEQLHDDEGNTVLQPRQNVIYELGAASLLYGKRIVILKEEGVTFPSDFSDLGYISFAKDDLQSKTMDLLKELIELKAVRVLPGV